MASFRRGERRAGVALAIVGLLVTGAPARADEGPWRLAEALDAPRWLAFGATHRTRYEHLFASPRTGGEDRGLSLRTTLHGELRADEAFALGVELIDARLHLADEDTPLDTSLIDAVDVLRAYLRVEVPDVGERDARLVALAGRLTLDLGSRRLVARNGFRNTINAFTGVDLAWRSAAGDVVRLFAVVPVERRPSGRDALVENAIELDRELAGLILAGLHVAPRALEGDLRAEGYALLLHEEDAPDRATTDRRLVTSGVRLLRPPGPGRVDLEVEAIAQLGAVSQSTDPEARTLDHVGFFVHLGVGYRFALGFPLRLAVVWDYASGDGDPRDGVNGRFDTLFGARRAELGPTGILGLLARSNLNSPGLVAEVAPHPTFDASVGYRLAWLAEPRDAWTATGLRDPTGATDPFVGQLLEARARFQLEGNVALELGYAQLFRGPFAGQPGAPATGDPIYVYASVSAEL